MSQGSSLRMHDPSHGTQ